MNDKDIQELFGHKRPEPCPLVARERFTVNEENQLFLQQCRENNFDVSTVINIALSILRPKFTPSGATWEGIRKVADEKLNSYIVYI